MTSIIIVGAGVVGASLAWRLSQSGASVTLVETFRPGGGSSGLSFAWPNAHDKKPRAYHELNLAGMAAHKALIEEWDNARWAHGGGHLEWYADAAGLAGQQERVKRLQDWDYEVEWLDGAELRRLEPDLEPGIADDHPVAWFPNEGWIDPVLYVQAMLAAARRHGASLVQARAVDLVIESGKAKGIRTAEGGTLAADLVVNCAGPDINSFVTDPALQVPLRSTPGLTVLTPPLPLGVTHILHKNDCALRPDGAGRLLVHSAALDKEIDPHTAEPRPDLPAVIELVRRVGVMFPEVAGFSPEGVRIGWRPIPGDTLPAIGPVPGLDGYYVVVTHSGVTLAALLGRLVAEDVLSGRIDPLIEPFRAARFFA